jgi:regulator of protease activity HflC (stomatin/prohibitin superfamily)
MGIFTLIGLGVAALVLLVLVFDAIVFTEEKTVTIITLFGQYSDTFRTSPRFKMPIFGRVAKRLSMAIQTHDVKAETITKDKVTVHPHVTVQYFVMPGKEREAYYNIDNPIAFIEACVYDAVRSKVPEMDLDTCFHNKDDIAKAVTVELTKALEPNGFKVHNVLVKDVDFDANVKREMNNINAAQRAQVAAQALAEAERTKKVTAAQADAEAMKLHGKGLADQREAVFHGWEQSAKSLQAALPGADATAVMNVVMQLNYMDTLKELGRGNTKVIMLPPPNLGGELQKQITEGILAGQEASKSAQPATADAKSDASPEPSSGNAGGAKS